MALPDKHDPSAHGNGGVPARTGEADLDQRPGRLPQGGDAPCDPGTPHDSPGDTPGDTPGDADRTGRGVLDTLAALGAHLRRELGRGWRAVRHKQLLVERPPSVRDRVTRVSRVDRHLAADGMSPLLRVPFVAGEYLAAAVATAVQTVANCVGTLPGLLTTITVPIIICQLTLGVPF